MNLPSWALMLISFAWTGLQAVLTQVGVPAIVIEAISAVLAHFGLLTGSAQITHAEAAVRAQKLKDHCSGVACPPDLVK